MADSFGILLLIVAGIINASFVVPTKVIKSLEHNQIWLLHAIIGMIVLPWLLITAFDFNQFINYQILNIHIWCLLIIFGFFFGIGQVTFAKAIQKIGFGLSFSINLGLAISIGSLYVVLKKHAVFSTEGIKTVIAVITVLISLICLYYSNPKVNQFHKDRNEYLLGWILCIIAGLSSGSQNIAFYKIAFESHIHSTGSFWVWPPFLTAAAVPMIFYFGKNAGFSLSSIKQKSFNLLMLLIMGICFSGSLVLYSFVMSNFNKFIQIVAWPLLMSTIILTSQVWSFAFKENPNNSRNGKKLYLISIMLLIGAIILLAS